MCWCNMGNVIYLYEHAYMPVYLYVGVEARMHAMIWMMESPVLWVHNYESEPMHANDTIILFFFFAMNNSLYYQLLIQQLIMLMNQPYCQPK